MRKRQETRREREQRAAAYHEAGHAVAYHLFGVALTSIRIDNRGGGRTQQSFPPRPLPALQSAAAIMAGPLAQSRRNGGSFRLRRLDPRLALFEDTDDAKLLELANGNQACLRDSRDLATRILTDNWPAVEAVANALLAKAPPVLLGDEVHDLIDRALARERKEETMNEPKIETWITPPSEQGQTIERSYGQDDEGGCWERTVDHSGPETSYRRLGSVEEIEEWEPWQAVPPVATR